MIAPDIVPVASVAWPQARRIIRSLYPPIDLFEDIADPADWADIMSREQKSNPRLTAGIGDLDRVPPDRRVGGPGSSYLMAPFTHVSFDRPSRFSDGSYGVLYVARTFRTALAETIHHHQRFMRSTAEREGWTSQFRELILDVSADLHDLRGSDQSLAPALDPEDWGAGQALGRALRVRGSDGVVYPSLRDERGECAGLFHPDRARNVLQGAHLDYHWNGERVDFYRVAGSGEVYRVD